MLELKQTVRDLGLVTVCEDAGCPNLSECWADGTATFMVLGERCTRACGFCLVDTSQPEAPAADEPERVAEAIDRMGLDHAVLTMVAPTTCPTAGWATSRRASSDPAAPAGHAGGDAGLRRARPEAAFEPLFGVRPDVFNHNVETVARLQRAVRPSAGYARSLRCWPGPRRPG